MAAKHFTLSADQIKPLAEGHGACLATDRIVVDGMCVGGMYREEPDFEGDSGWRCLAGDELEDYLNNPENFGYYEVNTVANYDPGIVALLGAPTGSQFKLDRQTGKLVAVD